jgi:hypothetical protein
VCPAAAVIIRAMSKSGSVMLTTPEESRVIEYAIRQQLIIHSAVYYLSDRGREGYGYLEG